MLELGASFDRYVLEAVLGEGGMGRVYRAFDPRLGRRVALKVLLAGPDRFDHKDLTARMIREARAAAAFNHANVVAIYDVGEFDGSPYIAMELVAGKTLRSQMGRDMPAAQKLAWLLDVARGLGAAHRAGLVHRDIKPENVMITTDGTVKILDFGIARLAEGRPEGLAQTVTPNLSSLTAEGVMIGTPQYMPPEQLRLEPLDGRADQFAWGVIAYELLAGRHPWAEATGAHLVAAVLASPVRPLREVRPYIDARVADAVARALEKDREARFATMEQLVAAVEGDAHLLRAIVSAPNIPPPNAAFTTADTAFAPAAARGATPPRTTAPARLKRGTIVAVGVAAVVAVAGVAALASFTGKKPARTASAPVEPAEAAPPSPRPSRISANPEAAVHFARALQEEHDAKLDQALPGLAEAIAADPLFAAAHLHRAGLALLILEMKEARLAFQRAWDLRSSLGDVDTAILEAMEPAVREPSVTSEYLARIALVSDRYPRELFPAVLAAGAYQDAELPAKALAMYDRALAADPTAGIAYFGKGVVCVHTGDVARGEHFFDECTRVSPTNLECLMGQLMILADEGRCEEAKGVARRGIANTGANKPDWDEALAATALATGEPLDQVREYLVRADEGTGKELHDSGEAEHAEQLAVLSGDFRAAEASATKWDAALRAEERESSDAMVARFAIEEEVNELSAHRADLLSAWTRSAAWLEPTDEGRLRLAYREFQVGLITKGELEQRRQAWKGAKIEEGKRSGVAPSEESLWRAMYVFDAETPDEAREAVAYYADAGVPKLSYETAPRDQLAFGLAFARAGSYATALPLLRDATRACRSVGDRLAQTQALFYLGQALEQAGDLAEARRAYEAVVTAWGKARPASVTAGKARARLSSLSK
jgi:serine/threonine-protein kinase